MPAGGPGDHPLTDMVLWNLPRVSPRGTELVRELAKVLSPGELEVIFDWWALPAPAEFERRVADLLAAADARARASGWEGREATVESSRGRRGKQIQSAIRDVLLHSWDPLGVRREPRAADEYDSYVGMAYRLIASGAAERAIVDALRSAEVELGASVSDRVRAEAARRLFELDVAGGF